jgi:hypothetical protein
MHYFTRVPPQVSEPYERALERLDAIELAALLELLPGPVMAMRGEGPFTADPDELQLLGVGSLPATLPSFARTLARPEMVVLRLRSLDRFCLQLVTLATLRGGSLEREEALTEAGNEHEDALDGAAELLRRRCLAERHTAWLVLLPGVADLIGTPGISGRSYLQSLRSEQLAVVLRNLGMSRPPSGKVERLDLIMSKLEDPQAVRGVLADAPAELHGLIAALIAEAGLLEPHEVDEQLEAGFGFEDLVYFEPVLPEGRPDWARLRRTPLHWLSERGLLGIDADYGLVFMPLEAMVALRGGLFERWEPSPQVELAPLADVDTALPPTLTHLDALLRRWERAPADGLKAGGIGVRMIRAAASDLRRPAGEIGVLAHLAVELDLVGSIASGPPSRRGKPTSVWTTTHEADRFRGRPAAQRWALLAAAWRDSHLLDEADGLPERAEFGSADSTVGSTRRRALLEVLAGLPGGQGVSLAGLADLADHHHPTMGLPDVLAALVAVMRVLGLVPADGPIGLSRLGRALVTAGPDAVEELLPPPETTFTVQADHSVVAPPNLAAEVLAALDRYSVRESDAGASIHRLDDSRIVAAFDDGETAEQVLGFLAEHAAAPLPQNVEYLVRDIERRHGRLRVGSASAYVTSDDPALIAEAVSVKASKLRQIAPTVAVTSLSRVKLFAALAAKGLMPVVEGADGAKLAAERHVAEPELVSLGVPELPTGGLVGDTAPDGDLVELAQRILHTREDDRDQAGTRASRAGGRR